MRKQKVISFVIVAIVMLAVVFQTVPALAKKEPKPPLKIFVDVSGSCPVVRDKDFAKKIGIFLQEQIGQLPIPTDVEVELFGVFDRENYSSFKYQILYRRGQKPRDVGKRVGDFVSIMPLLVERGKIKIQKETSIIGLLVKNAPLLKGANVIIISDALEESAGINIYQLLKRKKGKLPRKVGLLEGVNSVTNIGLGVGLKDLKTYERLKKLWTDFYVTSGMNPENIHLYSSAF